MKVETLKILVVEDEPDQRSLISQMLEANNYQITSADSVEAAIVSLKQHVPDLVFSDWKLGQLSGMDLLTYVRREHPDMGFIIATAYGTITHAVDAMQAGADDYLAKPYQRQSLLLAIEKVAKSLVLKKQNRRLTSELSQQQALVGIVGKAPGMQKGYSRVQRVSATDATVLIGGESGTGKELAARALYQLSHRKHKPFIAINCGSIPESLAESELFGAEKGAYTGATALKIGKLEAANGGTFFLDEIGELPTEWNWLDGYSPEEIEAKNVHFTSGGPWFRSWKPTTSSDAKYALEWTVLYDGIMLEESLGTTKQIKWEKTYV